MRCEATHRAEAASEAFRVSAWSNWVPSDAQMNLFVSRPSQVDVKCRLKDVMAHVTNWSHYTSSWRLNDLINSCTVGASRWGPRWAHRDMGGQFM